MATPPERIRAPVTSGPTAPVPKDPQPNVDRIDDLARQILSGGILLPKFQRNFVWERQQVLDLLDSIARNFPIGSILLWQSRQELRSENRIADLDIQLPRPDYPVNYLLDGQQRLSSICGALYWGGSNPKSIWNIAYDLRDEKFVHLDNLEDPPLHQIRLNRLPDPAAFFRHVASLETLTAPDRVTLKSRSEQLFNRFKDYKIAVVTLGDMSIEDVAPIFERINSTGTALTIVDLMRAATWSQDFDLIDEIEGILSSLDDKGFGGIDKKAVLRNISAAAGGGFSASSIDNLRKHNAETLKSATIDTRAALARVVDFLTTEIKAPGDKIVPYVNQIVVLGEIYRLIPIPSAQQYAAIKRWFWRTSITGYFGGWNTANMNSDLDAVRKFAANPQSTDIEVDVRQVGPSVWEDRQFRLNGAHAKVLSLVLSYHQPQDLLTGARIDTARALAWENSKEFHHFFPQDYLKTNGVNTATANKLANIVMLTSASNKTITNRAPSDYLASAQAALGSAFDGVLRSNLISPAALAAALSNDYGKFAKQRAQTIDETVKALAGWH